MQATLPKILAVEDEQEIQAFYEVALKDHATVIHASTLEDAENMFSKNPTIALIVLDGCIKAPHMNTLPLLRLFRETFSNPIIAASKSPFLRDRLMEAGCSHQSEKSKVPELVIQLLGNK